MENEGSGENLTFVRVTFTIPTVLLNKLERLCKRKGYNRSEALRTAIRMLLEKETKETLKEQKVRRRM